MLLTWHLLGKHLLTLIICISNYKIDLRSLVGNQMSRLFVKKFFHFFVLDLVKHPLKKFLKFILPHDSL